MTVASPAARPPRSGRAERVAPVLGVLAAILYNSWPLGFRLDRPGMRGTYISVLEVPGRPDAHLFVACDVLAGIFAIGAGLLLGRSRGAGVPRPIALGPIALAPIALCLIVFGVGNILEASVPIDATCAVSVASCGTGPGAIFAPHDLASLASLAGIAIGLWALRRHSRWMRAVIGLWVVTGLFTAVSVVVVRWVTASQVVFIVASGVALAALPLAAVQSSSGRRALGARDR